MIYKKILLSEIDSSCKDESTYLRVFISERNESVEKRPGLLICPGGGYGFCSERECEPIAFRFLSEGFNCFVLNYSIESKYPRPHLDLAIAFNYIKEHEEEFDLIPNSLSLIGFSAGGHLVGTYAYLYKELAASLSLEEETLRPFSIVLAYPVTTKTVDTHLGTFNVITNNEEELLNKLDILKNIDSSYPPTFIWATKDDTTVPYLNSKVLFEALTKLKVETICHIYESGWHGASLANNSCCVKGSLTEKMKDIRDWASLASDFIFHQLDK